MDEGPKALLEVWKASLDLFLGSFGYKGKTEFVQISIRIYAIREKKPMRCHWLQVDRLFNEIEKEKDFIHKKGITKKKPIAPKVDLLAWYIDTTTSRCLRTYDI
jgi:hypothetical protein